VIERRSSDMILKRRYFFEEYNSEISAVFLRRSVTVSVVSVDVIAS